MRPWIYALLACLGGVSFGILSTFVKVAYSKGFTTAEVTGAQFLFGALLFSIIMLFSKRIKTPLSMIIKLILSGIPMALTAVFYYNALNYLDASIAIIMLFQFTWMGLILEWIIDKRIPTREKTISVFILFIGSLFAVNIASAPLTELPIQGVLWGILAAMSFTGFVYVSSKVGVKIDPIKKSMLMSTGSVLIIMIIFPPTFIFNGAIGEGLWVWGLILGFFGVVLPPFLFSISMPKVGSGLGTILSASELPTAVIMSIIVLKEHVSWTQWIGVFIVFIGIAIPALSSVYYDHRMRRNRAST